MDPNDHPLLMGVLTVAFVAVLAVLSHRMRVKHADRYDLPRPRLFAVDLRAAALVAGLLVMAGVVAWLSSKLDQLQADHSLVFAVVVSALLTVGLLCLLIWGGEKRDGKVKPATVIAEMLGIEEHPDFRRRAFTATPEEQEIRGWQGLRVGLSVRESQPTSHGIDVGMVQFTVDLKPRLEAKWFAGLDPDTLIVNEVRSGLAHLPAHPDDHIGARDGKLEVRLALWRRELVNPDGERIRLRHWAVERQFPEVVYLAAEAWDALQLALQRILSELR
ncbi:MAG: hypothetical protein AAGM22_20705 [Acidobacteriota bacterium]